MESKIGGVRKSLRRRIFEKKGSPVCGGWCGVVGGVWGGGGIVKI